MRSRVRSFVAIMLLLGIVAVGMACSKAAGDSEVTGAIQNKISSDSGLQGKQLAVQTSNGVVTLSGTVDNDVQRTAASRYASSVSGVKQVVNDIQVSTPVAQMQPDQENPSDQPAPPEPRRQAAKPRPALPRQRSTPSSSQMAASNPPPSTAPVEDSRPAPAPMVAAAAPAPPPPPKKVTIPSGTNLSIRLVDAIDSETAQAGQSFRATLDSPLAVDGDVVIAAGHDVQGHIVDVKSAGKFAGKSELILQLDRISAGGKSYAIETDQYQRQGNSRGKNTAEKVGAGAAIGAIIGGIAGGGKGAAIGAAAGGGVGGGVQAATKGQQIKLPSETVLNFSLQSSVTVTPTTEGPGAGRRKLDAPAPRPPTSAPENLGPQS